MLLDVEVEVEFDAEDTSCGLSFLKFKDNELLLLSLLFCSSGTTAASLSKEFVRVEVFSFFVASMIEFFKNVVK